MAPRISVLMPCYNAAATLDETVASILSQTLADLELVAVDDGSTDERAARLQAWVAHDSRIRLIRQEHPGIVDALRAGLAGCRAPTRGPASGRRPAEHPHFRRAESRAP